MNIYRSIRRTLTVFLGAGIVGFVVFGYTIHAQPNESEINKAIIAEEVNKELRRLIDEEGFLDQAIEKGIETYIQKQQAAIAATKRNEQAKQVKDMRPVSKDKDHIYGNPEAPVSLVEYSDFECPFCKRYHPTVKKFIDKNGGKVNWVYRHFPLQFHNPGAQKEAEATECAAEIGGNMAFWRYSDLIYERTKSNGKGFPITNLVPLAEEIGLNGSNFQDCLDSSRMAARVKEDYEDGVKIGISGTPGTIFLNHQRGDFIVTAGALPLTNLQAALDRLLDE